MCICLANYGYTLTVINRQYDNALVILNVYLSFNVIFLHQDIEITSWLVSAYDFSSRVVKDRQTNECAQRTSVFSDPSQRVNNKNRTNEPTMK